jgi:GPH family glycoside/pentoside/hexuronide:cation symporter
MSNPTQKLPVREKIGYSLGDVATNFFFSSMILYQTRFYTDTVGLSAVAVGAMFLVLRLGDAVFDPIIGALADRTQSRWGKFRPWILFTAIPFGVVFWLVYLTPNFGAQGKLIYAYITYTLLMILYSANNTPYSALMGVMTPDVSERTNIARYRFVAALSGQFLIQGLALPLVDKFGHGDSAKGWAITMAIFGSAIVIFNLITFSTTRERVIPDPRQKSTLREDLKDVFTCGPWLVMFVLTLLVFTTLVLRGSSLNYYFAYYLQQGQIRAFLDQVGLTAISAGETVTGLKSALAALGLLVKPDGSNAAGVGLSFFLVSGTLIQIVGIIFSKPLADRFGKKAVFITGMSLATVATALIFFVPRDSMNLLFAVAMLWPLGWGPTVPLLWVMIADVADYSEWKNFRRATAFMYAGVLFALKAGLGLGGFLSGALIGLYGYVPNVAQSEHTILGIRLCATLYPALPFALGVVCLIIYPIGKQLNLRLQEELTERRKQFAAG